ncbi:flagellar assembly protein T N-terminal domain-containing protein [Flocculibacter collagenilyticus]|uniref:flagellar assembly protein T N-terminal domain-containing protein n=1 Tax=Flocculibacter collagenilyticus TaxID=2744479 RepID=UPI0018F7CD3E|nr:flagellar assembly protein T N-terminal domain-containing protein [Flocculibacter collagenilyticus]
MTHNVLFGLLLATGLLISTSVSAEWYEAVGQAEIRRGDKDNAQQRAIQDAVKHALLFSGATVNSIQEVSDGVLTNNAMKIMSSGSVQSIELINETHTANSVMVTIRLDITSEQNQCTTSDFKKSIAITQFNLSDQAQAKIGGLYYLGKDFAKKLTQNIERDSFKLVARPWYQKKLNLDAFRSEYFSADDALIEQISARSDSQFVLFGTLTDVSMGDKVSSDLTFWRDDVYDRYFAVEYIIFDAFTKELIDRNQITLSADWTFNLKESINTNSSKFWHSTYGQAIERVASQLQINIEEQLACQQLEGKILKVIDNQVVVNLGKENGVEPGQTFIVAHRTNGKGPSSKTLPAYTVTQYKIRIEQSHQHSAIGSSIDDMLLGNVQEDDVILLAPINEFD